MGEVLVLMNDGFAVMDDVLVSWKEGAKLLRQIAKKLLGSNCWFTVV